MLPINSYEIKITLIILLYYIDIVYLIIPIFVHFSMSELLHHPSGQMCVQMEQPINTQDTQEMIPEFQVQPPPDPEVKPMYQEPQVNPWQGDTLQTFCFYCCPECEFKCHSEDPFQSHALQSHPQVTEVNS